MEIISGKIYKMSPAPLRYHQQISVRITSDIDHYLRRKSCKVYSAPFDVRIPMNGRRRRRCHLYGCFNLIFVYICDPKKLDDRGCIGAPDMIVEIISPSTAKKDLNEKLDLYESSGVREYWIVFPKERFIMVHLLNDKGIYELIGSFEPNSRNTNYQSQYFS